MVSCWVNDTPAAWRVDQEQVDAVVGAGQHHQPLGHGGEGHVPLDPVEHPAVAVGRGRELATPSGPNPRCGSSQAGTTMASPEAIRGSHACCWSSDPAATSTPAHITALAKWGDGASERPSSS